MVKEMLSPQFFYQLLQKQKETQVLLASLRLKLFTYLDKPVTAELLSKQLDFDAVNLDYLLRALVSIGVLQINNDRFVNSSESRMYLSENSEFYLGEYFLFWEKKTGLCNIEEFVRKGSTAERGKLLPHEFYDFHELARLAAVEIKTGRARSFVQSAAEMLPLDRRIHVLDLGGGSGRMLIELAKEFKNVTGVVFEHPSVIGVPQAEIAKENLKERLNVMPGDFCADDIGTGYDLVIASGILDFAGTQLNDLVRRIYQACNEDALLYLVSHEVSDDMTYPKEAILGWLSSHLAGLAIVMPKKIIRNSLEDNGFNPCHKAEQGGVIKKLQGEWYKKS